MKLRAIRTIDTYEITGFGLDEGQDQEGRAFGDGNIWSKLVLEPDEIPNLSELAIQRLSDYEMGAYKINAFIINKEETEITQRPDTELFASIPKEIVARFMDNFVYADDVVFAEEHIMTVVEMFPERYYEDEEGIIRRIVDDQPADQNPAETVEEIVEGETSENEEANTEGESLENEENDELLSEISGEIEIEPISDTDNEENPQSENQDDGVSEETIIVEEGQEDTVAE